MQTKLIRSLLLLCVGSVLAHAETQNSEIQGLLRTTAAANSDSYISPAFGRAPVWSGTLAGVSGTRITLNGSPGFTTDQYAPGANTYYVRLLSGALAGHYLTVTSNDSSSVVVDDAGLTLTSLAASDRLELVPYWTLGTLYPVGDAGVSFVASSSPLLRQTEIYFYDPTGSGINRAPAESYYFYNGAWRKIGSAVTASFNGKIIPPDSYFLQRNKSTATTLSMVGRVQPGKLGTLIEGRSDRKQDNYVALAYPLALTLRQLGIGGTSAFATSTSPITRADELYVLDYSGTGINRAPVATYYYYNDGWRKFGSSISTDFSDTATIPAGTGFLIRRASGGATSEWVFNTSL